MPSKYDRVLPGLAPAPVADQSYQDKVDAAKGRVRWVACQSSFCHNRVLTLDTEPRCELCNQLMEATLAPVTPTDLAKHYASLRAEKARLDALAYDVNLRIEALTQMLVASQEAGEEGWGQYGAADNALRLATGDKVEVRPEVTGVVKDKEAYRLWCVTPAEKCMVCGREVDAPVHDVASETAHLFKPGGGYERQMQLWPATTNAIIRERLLAGEPEPDGTEAYRREKIVFTPMKPEKVDPATRRVAESEVL